MPTLRFKTNINCSGCIKAVTPLLNNAEGVTKWNVDTTIPEKVLTVEAENIDSKHIEQLLEEVGFTAEACS